MHLKSLIAILALSSCTIAMAQDDPEYRMEIGGGIGMMNYEGDFNSSILSGENMAPSASILLRRVINPYSALRFALGYGRIKGTSKNLGTYYPDYNNKWHSEADRDDYDFSNTLIDFNAMYEYNFFPYGTGRDYRGAKRLTPFVAIGLGFTFAYNKNGTYDLAALPTEIAVNNTDIWGAPEVNGNRSVFTANLPIGFGVKYKLAERVNLGVEWIMHFSMSDKLDGVKDPYRIKSSGLFKNTDCYSNLQVTLTYSFWEKCKTCMKD